jgi:hypothetical protein
MHYPPQTYLIILFLLGRASEDKDNDNNTKLDNDGSQDDGF